jgi:hypothetical protein
VKPTSLSQWNGGFVRRFRQTQDIPPHRSPMSRIASQESAERQIADIGQRFEK